MMSEIDMVRLKEVAFGSTDIGSKFNSIIKKVGGFIFSKTVLLIVGVFITMFFFILGTIGGVNEERT